MERINNRIDNSFGFERHFIRGQAKMRTRVGLALAVMMAMALGHVKAGRIEQMRSLVLPIPATGEQRDLAFQGFEAERDSLKYRCPAAAYGLDCEGQVQCHQAGDISPGDYGRIVRIKITEQDRRIFTPTPHGSPSWRRGYNRRSALERINNRIDNSFGFERHFIRGQAKMQTRVGLALAVMMAMALGHVKAGRIEQMRSLVQPIPATG